MVSLFYRSLEGSRCGVLKDLQIQDLDLLYIPDGSNQRGRNVSMTNVLDDLTSSAISENLS